MSSTSKVVYLLLLLMSAIIPCGCVWHKMARKAKKTISNYSTNNAENVPKCALCFAEWWQWSCQSPTPQLDLATFWQFIGQSGWLTLLSNHQSQLNRGAFPQWQHHHSNSTNPPITRRQIGCARSQGPYQLHIIRVLLEPKLICTVRNHFEVTKTHWTSGWRRCNVLEHSLQSQNSQYDTKFMIMSV